MIVTAQTAFDVSPEAIWATFKTSFTFMYVTLGFLGFSGADRFPARGQAGDTVPTRMWFFRVIPAP